MFNAIPIKIPMAQRLKTTLQNNSNKNSMVLAHKKNMKASGTE
jgi:hypothetical protein